QTDRNAASTPSSLVHLPLITLIFDAFPSLSSRPIAGNPSRELWPVSPNSCDGSPGGPSLAGDNAPSLVKRAAWSPDEGGCWTDNTNNQPTLEHYLDSFDDLTPAEYQALCDSQGFPSQGLNTLVNAITAIRSLGTIVLRTDL
ncbi:hypothetical protein FRC20_008035, partial [Serendipita sp. 405]